MTHLAPLDLTAFLRTGWHTMPEIAAAVGHHPAWVWVLVKRIAVTSPVFRQHRRAFRKPWEYRMFREAFRVDREVS